MNEALPGADLIEEGFAGWESNCPTPCQKTQSIDYMNYSRKMSPIPHIRVTMLIFANW